MLSINNALRLFNLTLLFILFSISARAAEEEFAWPREVNTDKYRIVMYQPQVESYSKNIIHGRSAISVTPKDSINPIFGVVWMETKVSVDRDERLVSVLELKIKKVNFPNATEEQEKVFASYLEQEIPTWDVPISLDRLIVSLELAEKENKSSENLKNDPPSIIFTTELSMLITIDGEPILEDIENTNLQYIANTPFFIVFDKSSKSYYLYGGAVWYASKNIKGDWNRTANPPKEAVQILEENLKDVEEEVEELQIPDEDIANIIVSTEPTELISTDGEPKFAPISETDLLYVENTDNDIFLHIDTQNYFILISGRWFTSISLNGPWSFIASDQLPETFLNIPSDSPAGEVRTSIVGTEEALDAVLDSHIPQTSVIDRNDKSLEVSYDGDPEWDDIEDTDLQYATNTTSSVIKYGNAYYACEEAVWYQAGSATGPWIVCVDVPDEIYSIPPSCPIYNVKYVYVYESTPEVVYVGYSPGYTYSYVYSGVIVYGTGYYYRPWYRRHYYPRAGTWGFGIRYNPYSGWGLTLGFSFGGGRLWVGFSWGRRSWWGPRGYRSGYRRGYRAGYNAGRRNSYRNASRNINRKQTQRQNNVYNKKDNVNRNRDVSKTTDRKTTDFSTRNKNNVYADKNGNVQRKTDKGWETKDKSGWSSDNKDKVQDKKGSTDRDKTNTDKINVDRNKSTNKNKSGVDKNKSSNRNKDYNNRQRSNSRHNNAPKQRSGSSRRSGGGRRR